MALLQLISMFCNFPGGKYVAPFFMPIINPLSLFFGFVPTLLIMYFAINPGYFNSNDNKTKSFWVALRWAFLFYYLIACVIFFILAMIMCKVSDTYNVV